MVKSTKQKITLEQSCMLRTLHQVYKIKVSEIVKNKKRYPGFANIPAITLYRHAKKPLDGTAPLDRRHNNKGRPSTITAQDLRAVKRQIQALRCQLGTFTSIELQHAAGLTNISNSMFRRYLRKLGYGYRRTRKKGLISRSDLKKRLHFAKKVKRVFKPQGSSINLWTRGISMYVDGVGFEYKMNPFEHSKTPAAREWRMKNEGLNFGCTTKGKKEGATQVKFLVGIGHNKGVVLCEQILSRMNGSYYASLVRKTFPRALKKTMSPKAKRILIDGDPSQNSNKARIAIRRIGGRTFSIPPRSPDLNPIENLFHLVRKELQKDARSNQITKESKVEFAARVSEKLASFSVDKIDKIIETMPKRIDLIIKGRGKRLKY